MQSTGVHASPFIIEMNKKWQDKTCVGQLESGCSERGEVREWKAGTTNIVDAGGSRLPRNFDSSCQLLAVWLFSQSYILHQVMYCSGIEYIIQYGVLGALTLPCTQAINECQVILIHQTNTPATQTHSYLHSNVIISATKTTAGKTPRLVFNPAVECSSLKYDVYIAQCARIYRCTRIV